MLGTCNSGVTFFQKACHVAWQRCYKWFLLPQWADHVHDWEVYDFTMAGCRLCGVQHVCGGGTCNESVADHTEVEKVCLITGLCIPTLRTADAEFTDCSAIIGDDATILMSLQTDNERDESFLLFIQNTVRQIIMSRETERALLNEWKRNVDKRALIFTKVARSKKDGGDSNLLDIFRYVIHETSTARTIMLLPKEEREQISLECSQQIFFLLKTFYCVVGNSFLKRGEQKRRCVVVGLLYIMRSGITVSGIEILSSLPVLKAILPHETLLHGVFGLRPKIITETENFIKAHLRNVSENSLRKLVGQFFK